MTFNFYKFKKAKDLSSISDLRDMYKSLARFGFKMPSEDEIQKKAEMCKKSIEMIKSVNL